MTGIEALQAMKDGKKVRRTSWTKGEYIYWDKEICNIFDEKNDEFCSGNDTFLEDAEWEVYNEDVMTIQELVGYTIRYDNIDYFVVPHYVSRIHRGATPTTEFCLMPIRVCDGLGGMMISYPASTEFPKKSIIRTPEGNGLIIKGYESEDN